MVAVFHRTDLEALEIGERLESLVRGGQTEGRVLQESQQVQFLRLIGRAQRRGEVVVAFLTTAIG